jgi:integrase
MIMTTTKKAPFIPAKIYQTEKISEKWFVFYSYWSESKKPEPGYLRLKVYEDKSASLTKGNKIINLKDKIEYFTKLATSVNNKLTNGWSPFGEGYSRRLNSDFTSIDLALRTVIDLKKSSLAETAFKSFQSHVRMFNTWLTTCSYSYMKCGDIGKRHIVEFLYDIQAKNKLTNRTFNNYLIDINSAYALMKQLEYIAVNPCVDIDFKPTKSNKHLMFDEFKLAEISEYIGVHNPYLQLYCRFIWMGFRPIEIVRLKVSDVDLRTNVITLQASDEKTGETKFRNILETFRPDIEKLELDQYPGDYYLFSALKKPQAKGTTRDFFTSHFKKVKDHFKLPKNFTMYGLRHTMIITLVKAGEPYVNIMKISGHLTLQAFQLYIQQYIDDVPTVDVSHRYKLTI